MILSYCMYDIILLYQQTYFFFINCVCVDQSYKLQSVPQKVAFMNIIIPGIKELNLTSVGTSTWQMYLSTSTSILLLKVLKYKYKYYFIKST